MRKGSLFVNVTVVIACGLFVPCFWFVVNYLWIENGRVSRNDRNSHLWVYSVKDRLFAVNEDRMW